jgi:putative flippase GtrA
MPEQNQHSPKWTLQFMQFASVGAVGTMAHYGLLVLLVEMLGVNSVAASTAGATLGALVNYVLNRRYTFRSVKRHREALTKFLLIAASGLALNASFMLVFVETLDLYYLVAQVLSTGLVLVWNFIGNRFWTFSDAR